MVTLLGFMCIIFNVGLLVVMMPDLEGPVIKSLPAYRTSAVVADLLY
jgi:hypothetical protein